MSARECYGINPTVYDKRISLRRLAGRCLPGPIVRFLGAGRRVVWLGLEFLPSLIAPQRVCEPMPLSQSGRVDATFLMGTSSGLLFCDCDRGGLHRVIDGYVYGITRCDGRWYVFRKHVTKYTQRAIGQIVSFELRDLRPERIRLEVSSLDPSVHQIDAWDGHLYAADTANNRIIRYALAPNGLSDRQDFYPSGRLEGGEDSDNYVHLNSIFSRQGKTYLVYHNHTTKTGRSSQIAILNRDFDVSRVIDIPAGDAHNVVPNGAGFMYCDSKGGAFVSADSIFNCGCFTRGLAVARDVVLIGGSDFAEKDDRDRTTGYVFALDAHNCREIARLKLPGVGSVYEIRLIEPVDLALSGSDACSGHASRGRI